MKMLEEALAELRKERDITADAAWKARSAARLAREKYRAASVAAAALARANKQKGKTK